MYKRICTKNEIRNQRGLTYKESQYCGYEKEFGWACGSDYACKFQAYRNLDTGEITRYLPKINK